MQEQGRSTEGELWLSEGALHWTSAPMSDITNRAPTRDSCQPANGGFRIAMGDVESVRSVGDTRPTLEVKMTTMSDPVLLVFLGPGEDTDPSARSLGRKQTLTWSGSCACAWRAGSVSAAMAAVEAFPVHLYQGKAPPTDAAALQSPPVDGPPMASAGDRAALPALIREFIVVGNPRRYPMAATWDTSKPWVWVLHRRRRTRPAAVRSPGRCTV